MAYTDVADPSTLYIDIDTPIYWGIRERMVIILFGLDVPTDLDLTDSDDRYRYLTYGFYPGMGVPTYSDVSDPSTTYTDRTLCHGEYGFGLYGSGYYGGYLISVSDSSTSWTDVASP